MQETFPREETRTAAPARGGELSREPPEETRPADSAHETISPRVLAEEEEPLVVVEGTIVRSDVLPGEEEGHSRPPGHLPPFPGVLIALSLLCTSALVLCVLAPVFAPSATVTLVPATATITTTVTVTVVAGTPDAHSHQVQGRLLSSLTLSEARTVPTTGTGYQQARVARGLITLYNALPAPQTVPAGTLLMGRDRVQVVTDEDAMIPAGSLAKNGRVTVPAQAVEPGPEGNIAAHDLYGPCCRADVFAQNSAPFTGGQYARSYPAVTEQDLSGAVSALTHDLKQSANAAFQAQVRGGETLLTPVACTTSVTANHAVRDEATQVKVTLSESCTGEACRTEELRDQLTQSVLLAAAARLGTGYDLTGDVELSVMHSTLDRESGTTSLQVRGTGRLVYQVTQDQLRRMVSLIAGKSETEAIRLLSRQHGVRAVSVIISGWETATLPRDSKAIGFLVASP